MDILIPVKQMGVFAGLVCICFLFARYRLGLALVFAFSFYWVYVHNENIFFKGEGVPEYMTILYMALGFLLVLFSLFSLLSEMGLRMRRKKVVRGSR